MNWGEWLILTVYFAVWVGILYIIWQLGKERGDD